MAIHRIPNDVSNHVERKVICEADKVAKLIKLKTEGKLLHVTHIIYFNELKPI